MDKKIKKYGFLLYSISGVSKCILRLGNDKGGRQGKCASYTCEFFFNSNFICIFKYFFTIYEVSYFFASEFILSLVN